MRLKENFVSTSQGKICFSDIGNGFPIFMMHGQGACKEVFHKQFESPLAGIHRLIAIDLPGCGDSDPAHDPEFAYTLPGMATIVHEVLNALAIDRAAFFGWSIGGHIALEMLGTEPDRFAGLMLSGTPPIHANALSVLRAFHARLEVAGALKPIISRDIAERFAKLCYRDEATPERAEAFLNMDGQMRALMTKSITRGSHTDQRIIAETSPVPLAIVNGADDPLVRVSYINSIRYGNLWENQCHTIAHGGHIPFLLKPNTFNALLHRFAMDVKVNKAPVTAPQSEKALSA